MGYVDDQRVTDLSLPLSFVRCWHRPAQSDFQQEPPFDLPAAFAAMKLTLLPGKFECPELGHGVDIAMEPSMLAMLCAGRVSAVEGRPASVKMFLDSTMPLARY